VLYVRDSTLHPKRVPKHTEEKAGKHLGKRATDKASDPRKGHTPRTSRVKGKKGAQQRLKKFKRRTGDFSCGRKGSRGRKKKKRRTRADSSRKGEGQDGGANRRIKWERGKRNKKNAFYFDLQPRKRLITRGETTGRWVHGAPTILKGKRASFRRDKRGKQRRGWAH